MVLDFLLGDGRSAPEVRAGVASSDGEGVGISASTTMCLLAVAEVVEIDMTLALFCKMRDMKGLEPHRAQE